MSEMIVGIDLGTCNSSAAIIKLGRLELIPFSEYSRIEGQYVLPSYVAYNQKCDVAYIGEAARTQAPSTPKKTFYNIKRLIGRKYEDGLNEAKVLNLPYDIVKGEDGYVKLKLENKIIYPHEVTAEILRHIKKDAENNQKEVIRRAVITVPAYFDDDKRRFTRKAGEIAGLEVVHVLVEPAAALLTYSEMVGKEKMYPHLFSLGLDYERYLNNGPVNNELRNAFEKNKCPLVSNAEISNVNNEKWEIIDEKMTYDIKKSGKQLKIYKSNPNIMVFDIGAGTLDIVIMSYKKVMNEEVIVVVDKKERGTKIYDDNEEERPTKFEPLVYEGDNSLGGANMDAEIMNYVLKKILDEHGVDLKHDSRSMAELKGLVENAKISLSRRENVVITINHQLDSFDVPLTRGKLEELVSPDIDRCKKVIERTLKQLKEKGIEKDDIDDIILVGGPTRMPIIQRMIEKEVGKPLRKIGNINDWNPMTCVATGAAYWIDIYKKGTVSEKDKNGGIIEDKKADIIDEGTPYAWGIIKNIGIDSILIKLIEKGTIYPTTGRHYSISLGKMEDRVKILIGQLNPANMKEYINLGEYEFRIVPLARSREIDVTFDLDNDGLLSVTMTNREENESLKFTKLVTGEWDKGTKKSITEVMNPDEEYTKKEETKREIEKKDMEYATRVFNGLGQKDRDILITQSMMVDVHRRMSDAYTLAQEILHFGMSTDDRKSINEKIDELNKLQETWDNRSINVQQYHADAKRLSNELINICEGVSVIIPRNTLNTSITNANKLIEKIEKCSGIPSEISDKKSELERTIGDRNLPDNKKYIRIEGRIEEIKHLLKNTNININ